MSDNARRPPEFTIGRATALVTFIGSIFSLLIVLGTNLATYVQTISRLDQQIQSLVSLNKSQTGLVSDQLKSMEAVLKQLAQADNRHDILIERIVTKLEALEKTK